MHPFFFIRQGNKNTRIDFSQILYIEASRNYTRLVTMNKVMVTLIPLKDWLDYLPKEAFCQVHRSFIVSLAQIHFFDNKSVRVQQTELPIGERYRRILTGKVVILGSEATQKQLVHEQFV